MRKSLKLYILEHKVDFDVLSPRPQVWDRISKALEIKEKKKFELALLDLIQKL